MANKFQQSVLQRLEQEAQKPATKSKTKPEPAELEVTAEPAAIEEPIKENQFEQQPEAPANPATKYNDISDFIRIEPARSAKNKTFYLDVEVIDALVSAARRQNVTDSKLCNDILRRVLGVGN